MVDVPEQRNEATDDTPAALHCNRNKSYFGSCAFHRRFDQASAGRAGRPSAGAGGTTFQYRAFYGYGDRVPASAGSAVLPESSVAEVCQMLDVSTDPRRSARPPAGPPLDFH
ncbi:MAG TPA: hypothetical protein VIH62_08235, partial [Xanthobacteraceae bacterium]